MSKIFAQIQGGIVVNTIVTNPGDVLDPHATWVEITAVIPQPGVGWSYDGTNFTAAPSPVLSPSQIAFNKLAADINFIQNLINYVSLQNTQRGGLTAAQKFTFLKNMAWMAVVAHAGDVTALQLAISQVTVDGTLVTQAMIDAINAKITAYLAAS